MSLTYKVENVSITAVRDRAMFHTFAGNQSYIVKDIGNEMSVTYNSSSLVVSLGTGEAVICGGSTISEGTADTLTLSANQSGYLVIEVNLALTGDNVCQFKNVSTLVQENINDGTHLVYDLPLYRYTTGNDGVSSMTDVRKIVASAGEFITSTLSRVATTGSYNDLSNKPSQPTIDTSISSSSTNAVQNKVIYTALNDKAPKNHASSATTYGVSTTDNYGHTKLVTNLTTSDGSGLALGAGQGKALKTLIDGKADASHTHGYINNGGQITSTGQSKIATGDHLVITEADEDGNQYRNKVVRSSITFNTSNTDSFLSQAGTWGTPSMTTTVLWTNSNPNSSFSAQTITADVSGYKLFMITYKNSSSSSGAYSSIVYKVENGTYRMMSNEISISGDGYQRIQSRDVTLTNLKSFAFADGYQGYIYSSNAGFTFSASKGSSYIVPHKIIGIK